MSFNTASFLTQRVADMQKQDVGDISGKTFWVNLIADGLGEAYSCIVRTLAKRGFSAAQIAAWDDGAAFERDIALWWIFSKASQLGVPYDANALAHLDRRQELGAVDIVNAAVLQAPQNSPGNVGVTMGTQAEGTTKFFRYVVDGRVIQTKL